MNDICPIVKLVFQGECSNFSDEEISASITPAPETRPPLVVGNKSYPYGCPMIAKNRTYMGWMSCNYFCRLNKSSDVQHYGFFFAGTVCNYENLYEGFCCEGRCHLPMGVGRNGSPVEIRRKFQQTVPDYSGPYLNDDCDSKKGEGSVKKEEEKAHEDMTQHDTKPVADPELKHDGMNEQKEKETKPKAKQEREEENRKGNEDEGACEQVPTPVSRT